MLRLVFLMLFILSALPASAAETPAAPPSLPEKLWGAIATDDLATIRDVTKDPAFKPEYFKAQSCKENSVCHLLSYVVSGGKVETVKMLVEAGAPFDEPDGAQGDTPLMRAIQQGNTDVAIYLVHKGANFNRANKSGVTPLMPAVAFGKPELVKAMLERGAKVDTVSGEMEDPLATDKSKVSSVSLLMMAVYAMNTEVVSLLLDSGVDPGLKDSHQRTAMDYAKASGDAVFSVMMSELIRLEIQKREAANGDKHE